MKGKETQLRTKRFKAAKDMSGEKSKRKIAFKQHRVKQATYKKKPVKYTADR